MSKDVKRPKISVITPVRDSEKYIERAIQSVLIQEYSDLEHIVIDGLSSDRTVEILKQYSHLLWISEKDSGQSQAMNKGFELATGDIVVYLNADDYFNPGVFQQVADRFTAGARMVLGRLRVMTSDGGSRTHDPSSEYRDVLRHWKSLFPINPVQYFYARELQATYRFNESNHLTMDHEFLLYLYQQVRPEKIPAIFGVFDMVEGSKTAEGLKDPVKYWSHHTFSYIDPFLEALESKEIIAFKDEQCDFFRTQHKKKTFFGLIRLKKELEDVERVVVYGAGTQFEAIHELFSNQVELVVDLDSFLQGKRIDGHFIQPLSALERLERPTILVTPFGYRDEITESLSSIVKAKLLFLEDYVQ